MFMCYGVRSLGIPPVLSTKQLAKLHCKWSFVNICQPGCVFILLYESEMKCVD